MPARLRASIVVIGDEILSGFVQDTNSGWLAEHLRHGGVPLDRIVTVPDTGDAIGEALSAELRRARPRLVLTSGGIGSTPDDLTYRAVASHLGLAVVAHPDLDAWITRALTWTAAQGVAVTGAHERAMRRMAQVPAGAWLLPAGAGTIPGVAVDIDGGSAADAGATVVVLPGVPSALRDIVRQGVEPRLLRGRGVPEHVAEVTHPYPESTLTPVLDEVVARFPDVHVGSYPNTECVVRLKGERAQVEAAMALVTAELDRLGGDTGAASLAAAWRARHADN